MVDVREVREVVNESIRSELDGPCQCGYDREELEHEIRSDDAIFIVATVDDGEASVQELTSLDESISGEVIGSIGARVMDFETFDRYIGSAERLVRESDDLSRSEFPVCEVGRWYVEPGHQSQSIGLRLAIALLDRIPRLDTYPVIGEAWQKDDRENGHINLFLRFGATKVGETQWGAPGSPDAVGMPDEHGDSNEKQVYSVLRQDRETIEQLYRVAQQHDEEEIVSMGQNLSLETLPEVMPVPS